jgi:hypothetical protein
VIRNKRFSTNFPIIQDKIAGKLCQVDVHVHLHIFVEAMTDRTLLGHSRGIMLSLNVRSHFINGEKSSAANRVIFRHLFANKWFFSCMF